MRSRSDGGDGGRRRRILLISKNVPWPSNSGEKMRTAGIAESLSRLGDLCVVAFADEHDDALRAPDPAIRIRHVAPPQRSPFRLLRRTVALRSITSAKWWHPTLRQLVSEEADRGADVVVVCHVQLAHYAEPMLTAGVLSVLDMHNVESSLTRRQSRTTRSWRSVVIAAEAAALKMLERRVTPLFDVVTVVSDADRRALDRVVRHPAVELLPNAIATAQPVMVPATSPTVCFVGLMSWSPNADAAMWFVSKVWPQVLRAVPEARLLLVGREPVASVRALASSSVVVTGTVESVLPWYAQARVAIAPLLAGGGSRLKILEALSYGRPVVATTVGAEGLESLIGRGIVTADAPEDFAREVAALLTDDERHRALSQAGVNAVEAEYSWQAATRALTARIEER